MKRKGICLSLIFVFIVLFFTGCGETKYEICTREISETRECFYFAKNDKYVSTFTSGQRESDYQLDGIHK